MRDTFNSNDVAISTVARSVNDKGYVAEANGPHSDVSARSLKGVRLPTKCVIRSPISGVNPRLDHRWDRMRLDRTAMRLQAEGRVDFGKLVSHTIPVREAQSAFDILTDAPDSALQIVLDFTEGAQ